MNGYFQLVHETACTKLRIYAPTGDGKAVTIGEIAEYLKWKKIPFELTELNDRLYEAKEPVQDILINNSTVRMERECYIDNLSQDRMTLTFKFYPPSVGGERMTAKELFQDLFQRGVRFGIQEDVINDFAANPVYATDIVVAQGQPPVQGKQGHIDYLFNTNPHAKPTLKEDGSVDFFQLNMVNHCSKGDKLAVLTPSVQGQDGKSILGEVVKPLPIKNVRFRYGRNIALSEDQLSLISEVSGHVSLADDMVMVSDVLEVENVDPATGNIDYEGSVKVNGRVSAGFSVKARGNIEVKGVVEGADLEAGENIIIARGMNGMGKGTLKAGNDIFVKYLENVKAAAEGNVISESILHSTVSAGNEIEVTGRRGFITGGKVTASTRIKVKTLGSDMGASTIVEVGVDPELKRKIFVLEKEQEEAEKVLKSITPVLEALVKKLSQGIKLTPDQVKNVQGLNVLKKQKEDALENIQAQLAELKDKLNDEHPAEVVVEGAVYPGTQIIISGASLNIQSSMKYCRFVRVRGDVKMVGM